MTATRLELALSAARLRTWVWDLATNRFAWSSYPDDDADGMPTRQVLEGRLSEEIVAADKGGVQDALRHALFAHVDFDETFRMNGASGVRWFSAQATVERDAAGVAVRMVGVAADVTERHLADEELHNSEAFLDSVVENIPTLVFVKDATDLTYVRVNAALETSSGCTREALIGLDDLALFPRRGAAFTAEDRAVLEGRVLVDIPAQAMMTIDGLRLFHVQKIPIFDEDGDPTYLLGIAEDITAHRSARRELEEARDLAEHASRAKSEFVSRMSHELRTPMNSVMGFAQLLRMDELTTEQNDYVGFIMHAGNHLLGLINEALDVASIETGNLRLSMEVVNVDDVVGEAVALMRPAARDAGVAIAMMPTHEAVFVWADRQRLVQVLLNLLSNALKYNRAGGSVVLSWESSGGTVSMSVADTGIGIAPANLCKLFVPFERLGAQATEIEGNGVGLALSRALTHQMDGNLTVSSSLGQGSTFTVELRVGEQT